MTSWDLAAIGAAVGASGTTTLVLCYGVLRLIDRVAFLVGLRMLLRNAKGKTSDAAVTEYIRSHAPEQRRSLRSRRGPPHLPAP